MLAVLAAVDVAVAIGLSATSARPTPEKQPLTTTDIPDQPTETVSYSPLPPEELGQRMGQIYQTIRTRVPQGSRVRLDHRMVGNDFEIVVELATIPGESEQGFPPRVYCLTCPTDRCRYDLDTYRALESMAAAVPRTELEELSATLGPARPSSGLTLTFVGGASGGKVYKWRDERYCDFGFVATSPRNPPAYDRYDAATCGVGACQVATTGKAVTIENGMDIDSNGKLACLRAACLRAASTVASGVPGLDIELAGDVSIEDGGARRGAAFVIRLIGIGESAHEDYYQRFNRSFVKAARGT
jgi:hypothetical protein